MNLFIPHKRRSSGPSKRSTILGEEGLQHAPAFVQEGFWQRHNRRRVWDRRPAKPLGDLAAAIIVQSALPSAERLSRVTAAFESALPSEYRFKVEVDRWERDCLWVTVDSSVTGFMLFRGTPGRLLDELNARLCGSKINRIRYRVAPMVSAGFAMDDQR